MLIGGAIACVVVVIVDIDGGPGRFLEIAVADHKFQLAQPGWSYATASLWVVLVGNVFSRLGALTSDQAVVQRYLTTRDEATARRALWTDVALSIPWAVIVFLLGTSLYVFYKLHPDMLNPALDTDAVVPLFVAQKMPAGLSGLIVAAVFAAAMSSLDSSMHSVATIWVTDVFARFRPQSSDRSRLRLARLLTLLLGVFAVGAAVWLASADVRSLWDQFWAIVGLFIGGLSGLFVLGIFTRRASAAGAMVGAIASGAVLLVRHPLHQGPLLPLFRDRLSDVLGRRVSGRPRASQPPPARRPDDLRYAWRQAVKIGEATMRPRLILVADLHPGAL